MKPPTRIDIVTEDMFTVDEEVVEKKPFEILWRSTHDILANVRALDEETVLFKEGLKAIDGWRFDPSLLVIRREDTGYEIDLERCKTPAAMLHWFFHLSEKEGSFDDAALGAFVRLVYRVGACRWHEDRDEWNPVKLFSLPITKKLTMKVPKHIFFKSKNPVSGVYVIRAGERDLVKIGSASDVRKRLQGLQTGCPDVLGLIGLLSDDPRDESKWHQTFASLRAAGEWFTLSDSIVMRLFPPSFD